MDPKQLPQKCEKEVLVLRGQILEKFSMSLRIWSLVLLLQNTV